MVSLSERERAVDGEGGDAKGPCAFLRASVEGTKRRKQSVGNPIFDGA